MKIRKLTSRKFPYKGSKKDAKSLLSPENVLNPKQIN